MMKEQNNNNNAGDILQWTSCLFAIVVLWAYAYGNAWYHNTFLLVTVMSLLRWTSPSPSTVVIMMDKAIAHWAFALVLWDTERVIYRQTHLWLLIFPLCVSILWTLEFFLEEVAVRLHAALHVVSAVGACLYIFYL